MNNKPDLLSFRDNLKLQSVLASIGKADRVALTALVAANIVPMGLALIFGWDIGDVVMFYWWENIVIGVYSILRIAMASGGGREMGLSRFFVVPFFTFHYFFFCFIHVIFLRLFFEGDKPFGNSPLIDSPGDLLDILPEAGFVGLIALLISHGMSFVKNYLGAGEYKTAIPVFEMFRPYGRIVVMHICILLGGFAIHLLGSPMPMIILLMIGKTILDLISHSIAHTFSQKTLANIQDQISRSQSE